MKNNSTLNTDSNPISNGGSRNMKSSRRTDPVTSHQAEGLTDKASSRAWLLTWVRAQSRPVTQHEATSAPTLRRRWSEPRIRTAFKELERAGALRRLGATKVLPSGRCAQLWEATE